MFLNHLLLPFSGNWWNLIPATVGTTVSSSHSASKKAVDETTTWNKTHLIFRRQHYSNGKGYESVRKGKTSTTRKRILPYGQHFSFKTVLRLLRFEFETDEKLFLKSGNIKFKSLQNRRSKRTTVQASGDMHRGESIPMHWQHPMNVSWPLS